MRIYHVVCVRVCKGDIYSLMCTGSFLEIKKKEKKDMNMSEHVTEQLRTWAVQRIFFFSFFHEFSVSKY